MALTALRLLSPVRAVIDVTALGGNAGAGTSGGMGGSGAIGGAGGNAGDGGRGGDASVEMAGLRVRNQGYNSIEIKATAFGGEGGDGGHGGMGGWGLFRDIVTFQDGSQYYNEIASGGRNGEGGNGGGGGDAFITMRDVRINVGANSDQLIFDLYAVGGAGGEAGQGGAMSPVNPPFWTWSTYPYSWTPAADAPDGADGRNGLSRISFVNNAIALGGGDDLLELRFVLAGPGSREMEFVGNVFDGGAGIDVFRAGPSSGYAWLGADAFPTARIDLLAGTVSIGGSAPNTLRGFEHLVGTRGTDVFVDASGSQTYEGGSGADRFEFRRGGSGTDRVVFRETDGDIIALVGFGPALDSFADVMARATRVSDDTWSIRLSDTRTLLLSRDAWWTPSIVLGPEDFVFT